MDEKNEMPMLLRLLFGERAEIALRGASERLRRWARAFEDWMEERGRNYKPVTSKQARLAWQRLLSHSGKVPWELERADIEEHAAWMQAEGYATTTINNNLGILANFYRWCSERQVDPECEAGFNPAAGSHRPKTQRYEGAKLLSGGEVGRLLGVMKRDDSPLGRRDYALLLARLRLGAPLSNLLRLKWGQIKQDEAGAWVRWRPEGERIQLPGEVWEALRAYLEAAGRLRGMREGAYVFPPLAYPGKEDTGKQAEDWREDRHLSSSAALASLKLYGRAAKILEEKLTLMALRRTAMRLRLEAGTSLEEMQVFLDSQEEAKSTKYRLRKLPQLPREEGDQEAGEDEVELPERKAKPFRPYEGMTHGYYAHSQPAEAVARVLRENIQGIEEEIVGLRVLARGLLEREGREGNNRGRAQLWQAYTLATFRLAEMIKAEEELAMTREESQRVEELRELVNRLRTTGEEEQYTEEQSTEEKGAVDPEYEPELGAASRRLVEEIAALRYVLRNAFRVAMEAEKTEEAIRLAEIYSMGCIRLVRLLKMERSENSRWEEEIKEQIMESVREANKGWKITNPQAG